MLLSATTLGLRAPELHGVTPTLANPDTAAPIPGPLPSPAAASVVVPIGLLAMGAARHRALLYKVLADELGMPCRILKGRRLPGGPRHAALCSARCMATGR